MTPAIVASVCSGDSTAANLEFLGRANAARVGAELQIRCRETRAGFLREIRANPPREGVVFAGHGRANALLDGQPERNVVFDAADAAAATCGWLHAICCQAGVELAGGAAARGLRFVGYETSLVVEWDIAQIPKEALPLLEAVASEASAALVDGVRDTAGLRLRVNGAAQRLIGWIEANPSLGEGLHLEIIAQQLAGRVVVRP